MARLLCGALVSVVTVDLGPAPARAGGAPVRRLPSIVRCTSAALSTYLLPGRFLIEDLVIDGLSPGDRPFFHGERIVVSTAWLPLLRGEVLVDDVDMRGWRMVVEAFEDGRNSFPPFAPRREGDGELPPAPEAAVDSRCAGIDRAGRRGRPGGGTTAAHRHQPCSSCAPTTASSCSRTTAPGASLHATSI